MFVSVGGPTGPAGATGADGAKGDKGDKGDTGASGNYNYVNRGDPAAVDYDKTAFTWDSAWYEKDLSSIVPAGAVLVHLYVAHAHSANNNWMKFRKNGNTNIYNIVQFNTRVAGVTDFYDAWVACDVNRKISYQGGISPTLFNVVVRGWITTL